MTAYWQQQTEDESGDLVDVDYYCDERCATDDGAPIDAVSKRGAYRLGYVVSSRSWRWFETDYATFCKGCGMPLEYGMEDARSVREQLTAAVAAANPADFADGGEAMLDVRVQYLGGDYIVHVGDPSFDTDHRGFWGACEIDVLTADDREIENVTHDLLTMTLDAYAHPLAS